MSKEDQITERAEVVVAIDPSLSNTAVVIGCNSEPARQCFGSKSAGLLVSQRIPRFRAQVDEIRRFMCQVTSAESVAVYIEGYNTGSHPSGQTSLCEYGGMLREMLLDFTNKVIEVPPSTLKKFATGKGNVPKDMVAAHLTNRYGVLLASNDEYDAYGLYRLGLIAEGHEQPQNQSQSECVNSALGLNKKPKKRSKKPVEL